MTRILYLLLLAMGFFCTTTNAQNYNFSLRDQLTYPFWLSNLWGYTDTAGNEYALVGTRTGLSIVNVSNPDSIFEMYAVPQNLNNWREVKTWNERAYVVTEGGGGVLIVNLSQLQDTISYHSFTGGGINSAHTLWIDENGIMYVFGFQTSNIPTNERGALVYDLNVDPDHPPLIGTFSGSYIHDGYVRGDTLWASEIYNGRLAVYDVTDKDDFELMAVQATPLSFAHNAWPTSNNQFIFTTDEKPNSTLTSYDVSALNNIQELDRLQSNPGSQSVIHNVHLVSDEFAAVSYYRDGVIIVDVSDPSNMIQTGAYDTYPFSGSGFNGNWGVYPYLPSGNWLVSDIEYGLFILTPTYVKAARIEGLVTDSISASPINNVHVTVINTPNSDITDFDGVYKTGHATAGFYTLKFAAAGYAEKTIQVQLFNDSTVFQNIQLRPLQGYPLELRAVSTDFSPVPAAKMFVTDYGFYQYQLTTGTDGTAIIPVSYPSDYDLIVGAWGYQTEYVAAGFIGQSDTINVVLTRGYYDDFYFDFGWAEVHTASSGFWERGIPIATTFNSTTMNPGIDVLGDFGNLCFVTGNGGGDAGNDDVDEGSVTLISPQFDLSWVNNPYINYSRWFANKGGSSTPNDTLTVLITNGIDTAVVEKITAATAGVQSEWNEVSFRVQDFLIPTSQMRLIFVAEDADPGHLVEAAIDKFYVTSHNLVAISDDKSELHFHPNPANDRLQMISPYVASYRIWNVLGQSVKYGDLDQGINSISLESLQGGIYIFEVTYQNTRRIGRFLKH